MKKTVLGITAVLIGLVAILIFWRGHGNGDDSGSSLTEVATTSAAPRNISSAMWVSNAMTVNQLMSESDLVVKVRVSEAPVSRIVRVELPVLDEKGNIVDSAVSEMLFSDTVFEVLNTYIGKPSLKITVMQTGGFDPKISNNIEEIADDPIYKIGEEYILFLVDISGDPVHAPDRELYRIVNPFGRYRIDGKSVFSYGQNLKSIQLPTITNVIELETQIEQAAQELNK